MKKLVIEHKKKIIIENFIGFLRRKIVPNGTSARVNCPKEYLGKEAYLIIIDDKNNKWLYLLKKKLVIIGKIAHL